MTEQSSNACCTMEKQAVAEESGTEQQHMYAFLRKSAIAASFGMLLMLNDIFQWLPSFRTTSGHTAGIIVALVTLLILFYTAGDIYHSAWRTLMNKTANMDTLIALGTGVAWIYSTTVVIFLNLLPTLAQHVYFQSALFIIAFINLGAALETRARGKTSQAIKRLLHLQPKTATVIREGKDRAIPVAEVIIGDHCRITPGSQIPVDGTVIKGDSYVNEAMLTGESMPIKKIPGAKVSAGTLNKDGALVIEANRVGKETALARIIQLVKQAQDAKPAMARLADKVSQIFVPIVVCIALVTAFIWLIIGPTPTIAYAVVTAISVLIIACPCALGLATPLSLMVGVGKAAEYGILIRNGEALQTIGKVNSIVFDKTGTITQGKPQVIEEHFVAPFSNLLYIAANVEIHSEHPLAQAIVDLAKQRSLTLDKTAEEFKALTGKGVRATWQNKIVILGNEKLMKEENIIVPMDTFPTIEKARQAGHTVILAAVDNTFAGYFIIADPIKNTAKTAIAQLKARGLHIVMLTGDEKTNAEAVATQVGITEVIANVLPANKLEYIKQLQEKNRIVAMVGDGINDAPALTQAHVGIAIGSSTDVAMESADMILMGDSLLAVPQAITLSQKTISNVKQNLWGAFFYNGLGIPIAAGILYPFTGFLLNPAIAGAAMALSSLTVVSNANRLRYLLRGL